MMADGRRGGFCDDKFFVADIERRPRRRAALHGRHGMISREQMGKIDVPDLSVMQHILAQRVKDLAGPVRDSVPVDRPLFDQIMGERGGPNAMVGCLSRTGKGAGDNDVLSHIPPGVDSGKYPVRLQIQSKKGDANAIRRRGIHRPAMIADLMYLNGVVGIDAMGAHGLLRGGRDDADSATGQGRNGTLQRLNAGCVDAIVISEKQMHREELLGGFGPGDDDLPDQ